MAESGPEPAQQLPDHVEIQRWVTLPAVPTVYGLEDPDEGVTKWVFALPDGRAFIVSNEKEEGDGIVHTSLDQVVHFWVLFHGADLVQVAT